MTDGEDLEWFETGKCRQLYKLGLLPTTRHRDPDTGEEVLVENDAEIFFPEKGSSTHPAKAICLGMDGKPPCRVLDRCREYAIESERYGVWGGTSERERGFLRAELRRKKRLAQREVVRGPSYFDRNIREA